MSFELSVARSGEILGLRAFAEDRVVIGRDPSAQLRIDHPALSRQHAAIEKSGTAYTIRDLGSQNGTFVNGKPLEGTRALNQKDEIQLGDFTLTFRAAGPGNVSVSLVQNESAYAVFGQTLQVRPGEDHEQRERSASVHAHLELPGTWRIYALDHDVLLVGRGSGCHVRRRGFLVPRVAAAIVRGHGGWSIVRLGWRSVRRNGEKILDRDWLSDGDAISVCGLSATFRVGLPKADALHQRV